MSCLPVMTGRALMGLVLLCLTFSAAAATQIPQPLTLDGALAWANDNNPALRGARIAIQRAGGQLTHADVAVPSNPRVQLEGARRTQPRGAGADIGIQISQTFWIAGQGGLREAAAHSRLAARRASYQFLQAATMARVRAGFLTILVAEQAVATAERVVDTNTRLATYADRRLAAGAGTRLETNAASLGLQRARALLARAENNSIQARLSFSDLLAIDPSRHLALAGQLDFNTADLPDSRELLDKAVPRRADLAAAAAQVVAAQQELSLAARELIPNLTVFGFYREEGGGRNAGGADIAGGGIGFEIPLLHRHRGEREIARADLAQAQLDQDTLAREVRLQVLSGMSAYRAASRRAQLLDHGVLEAAQNTLELTRRSFAAGKVGAPAITAAQNTLIDTRSDYLSALNDLIAAAAQLERATGGLLVMDNTAGALR